MIFEALPTFRVEESKSKNHGTCFYKAWVSQKDGDQTCPNLESFSNHLQLRLITQKSMARHQAMTDHMFIPTIESFCCLIIFAVNTHAVCKCFTECFVSFAAGVQHRYA